MKVGFIGQSSDHLFMEADTFDVVKDVEQVSLDGVRVRCLAQNLQQCRIWYKEETWKQQTLFLQIPVKQKTSLKLAAHYKEQ